MRHETLAALLSIVRCVFSAQDFDPGEVSGMAALTCGMLGASSVVRTASISSWGGGLRGAEKPGGGATMAGLATGVDSGVVPESGVPSGVLISLSVDMVDCSSASRG